jgi:predicted SnoaL-like aldol condensation-catalyzing enzyme
LSHRERNRQVVRDFYVLAFEQKRPTEAADRYFGDRYIQHNPFVADGIDGFKAFFENSTQRRNDDYQQRILRIVADEELVAVHATIHRSADDRGIVLVDIFRLEDGKIVEHWDVYKDIPDPAGIPHENGVL